jgi:hypothetical protein
VVRPRTRKRDTPRRDRPSLSASVGSTEAAKDVVARFGGIDRSRLGSSEYGVIGPNQIHIIDDGIPDERGVRVQDAAPLGVGPSSG